jgi:hypothetical protein
MRIMEHSFTEGHQSCNFNLANHSGVRKVHVLINIILLF